MERILRSKQKLWVNIFNHISRRTILKSWFTNGDKTKNDSIFSCFSFKNKTFFLRIIRRRFIWFSDFIFRCYLAKANYHLEHLKHQTHSNLIRERYTLNSKIINTNSRWNEMNKHRTTLKKTLQYNNLLNPCLHFKEAINKVNRGLRVIFTTAECKSHAAIIYKSVIFLYKNHLCICTGF